MWLKLGLPELLLGRGRRNAPDVPGRVRQNCNLLEFVP
jgi:hypothetical protein